MSGIKRNISISPDGAYRSQPVLIPALAYRLYYCVEGTLEWN